MTIAQFSGCMSALPVVSGLEEPEHQQTDRLHGEDLEEGPAEAVAHGAGAVFRTARPGKTPFTSRPSRTTKVPFTITWGIPAEVRVGCSKVARSITVAGSNTVISASARSEERRVGKECRFGWWPAQ